MTEIYFLKILILSVAQGIFEFIPVSSSGLLVVLEEVLKVESNNLLLNVTMHGGSLAAVVVFFFKDLISLWKNQKLLINLIDRKSTRLNSSHPSRYRMPSSA